MMKHKRCASCSWRAAYDRKPASLLGRIWKWHIGWCPGWKRYLQSLPEDQKTALIEQYGMRDRKNP